MNLNKIIGFVLLILGLLIIGWTLFESYNIFNGKTSAPFVFKTQTFEQKTSSNNPTDLKKQLNEALKKQLNEMLSPETFSKILNMISWSIFAGILILGGGQIAGLGIRLIS